MSEHVRNFTAELRKIFRKNQIFLLILCVGLFLRWGFIHFQGLSNDELSAWHRLRFNNWDEFWYFGIASGDMHPALYQILLKLWSLLFGNTEWSLRSLSLLFYVLNASMIQRICDRHYSQQSGWIVNATYAVFTFFVINTTLSRPYNSGVFFLLLAWLMVLELRKENSFTVKRTLLLALGFSGAMLSHYFAFLVAGVLGLISVMFVRGSARISLIVAGVLACLIFLPHLSVTFIQLQKGGLGWLAPPDRFWAMDAIFGMFNRSWTLAILMLGLIFSPFLKLKKYIARTENVFPIVVALTSILLAVILSYSVTPIMRELVMLFILPFVLIPNMANLPFHWSVKYSRMTLFGTMAAVGLHSVFINGLYEPIHFGVFREVGKALNKYDLQYGHQKITCAMNLNDQEYLNYYLRNKREDAVLDWYSPEILQILEKRLADSRTEYFCYVFNSAYDRPIFREMIMRYYPVKIQESVFPGSAIYLFKKVKTRTSEFFFKPSQERKLKPSSKEFDFMKKIKVSALSELDPHDYYVFVFDFQKVEKMNRIFSVLTLTRNGKPVMRNDSPQFYESLEQSYFLDDSSKTTLTIPFFLPKNTHPEDEILFYIWNPDRVLYRATESSLHSVK